MDMKIGEVREFEGKKYKAVESNSVWCGDCDFNYLDKNCENSSEKLGECHNWQREDKKNIIFVEVK